MDPAVVVEVGTCADFKDPAVVVEVGTCADFNFKFLMGV